MIFIIGVVYSHYSFQNISIQHAALGDARLSSCTIFHTISQVTGLGVVPIVTHILLTTYDYSCLKKPIFVLLTSCN